MYLVVANFDELQLCIQNVNLYEIDAIIYSGVDLAVRISFFCILLYIRSLRARFPFPVQCELLLHFITSCMTGEGRKKYYTPVCSSLFPTAASSTSEREIQKGLRMQRCAFRRSRTLVHVDITAGAKESTVGAKYGEIFN